MTKLQWDTAGDHLYETGVDHGVLYPRDDDGSYPEGYAWNGLTTVTESPSGAEATATYADNIKYLSLISAEEFGATVEAYTYPEAFAQCDGSAALVAGVYIGQQGRRAFGLAYRTILGNEIKNNEYAYKLHIIYGATAAPSEKAFASVNDSPEAITFSWALTTIPVSVGEIDGTAYKPVASVTIDSSQVDAGALSDLEDILYGTPGNDPRLPLPAEIYALFSGTVVYVTPTLPSYNNGTHTLTIPSVAGVEYVNDETGVAYTSGAHVITGDVLVKARPLAGYEFNSPVDDEFFADYS